MAQPALQKAPQNGVNVAVWVLQILAAAAFVAAGAAKLAGVEMMVQVFQKVGIGQWFRYLTGVLEVLGGVGLVLPRYTFYAASLLVCVMIGAVIADLAIIKDPAAPAGVLLLIVGTIAYMRRPK